MKLMDELLTSFACDASLIFVCHTKSWIVYREKVRLKSDLIVNLGGLDLSDGHLLDGLGVEQSKLKGFDAMLSHTELGRALANLS